ncbi:MAG: FAD-binding oxidoreductase [Acidobacteria bacterium]|nr:FAD-binding oxidoreductase [Acidobacteriota bacterium]
MTTIHPPADDSHCGWLEILPAPAEPRRLAEDLEVDCAVVGAGFTGLAAARRLHELEPSSRIVVLDAQRAGFGASGRSSGFVVDLAGFVAAKPPAEAERFIRLSRAGIAALRRQVEEHDIECAWDDRGWLHVAAGEPGLQSLERLESWLDQRGERFERLDRPAMASLCGSDFYRAGARLPGSVLVQAGALVRGLAGGLDPAVELYEDSPVTSLTRAGAWHLGIGGPPSRTIRARSVVLATNAALPALGFLRNRIFPLFTFGSLTRPLSQEQQEQLGGEREWGLLAQDPMGSSLRRTRDQRLLVRNSVVFTRAPRAPEAARRRAAEAHRVALARRFPELPGLELEHTWGGAMGMSADHNHFFGRLAPGLHAAGGYFGAGIALGTVAGELLAELVTERDSDLLRDMQALPGPAWIPPEPFLGWGVRWRVGRLEARAEHV